MLRRLVGRESGRGRKVGMNLEEIRNGVVHAEGPMSNDYTLCGVTTENELKSREEYTEDRFLQETETEPYFVRTEAKVDCETCAAIIRHCCKLGTRVIAKKGGEVE